MATYGFGENDVKRIGRVVRLVERGAEKTHLGGPTAGGAAPGVRMMVGKIAGGSWSKGVSSTVTIYSGAPTNEVSAITVAAWNYFASIGTSSNTARWVGLGNNGFGWVLIAAECD